MKKIAIIFGTRPEAIKMAAVVKQLKASPAWDGRVIVSGQHKEMLEQVLTVFGIQPDYQFSSMHPGESIGEISCRVIRGLEDIYKQWEPDFALVHGDTTTAVMSALTSFYQKIPVGHVEAGLRSQSLTNPFPEEANRRLIDSITTVYFAPTRLAADNLVREGINPKKIHVTGNTGIDALYQIVDKDYQFSTAQLKQLDFTQRIILITAHRRENWGEPLIEICQAIKEASTKIDAQFVFAMHKNPGIQTVVRQELGKLPKIHLVDAPDYREFANLLDRCWFLMTDSGGLQEEAMALNKPVLVLRDSTERNEGVNAGGLRIIGTKKDDIIRELTNLAADDKLYARMAEAKNPFGDGQAAVRIRQILEDGIAKWGESDGN